MDVQFEIFRKLLSKSVQVSTHTQIYQVVLMTITMVRRELGLDVYIDHGTFDGYRSAELAQEAGVPAIIGPRQVQRTYPYFIDTDGRMQGCAAGYQERGHRMVGFNTDAVGTFGIGQEELSLQAAVACRYGFDNARMDAVRGVTIVPAIAAGLDRELGSLEVGKRADLIAVTGDPLDPRTSIEIVWNGGRRQYEAQERRRW
jgi:imidazolonepropionase-like amidohydrolase